MYKTIFKFNSITYAIKAKNTAERHGCKTKMSKNPNPKKGEGCGYSLSVFCHSEFLNEAFDKEKIKYTSFEVVK